MHGFVNDGIDVIYCANRSFLYKNVIFVHFLDSVKDKLIFLDSLRIIDLIPILIIHKMNIYQMLHR